MTVALAAPQPRIDQAAALAPKSFAAMQALEKSLKECGLDHGLLELVKLRASQINGCVFCIELHVRRSQAMKQDAMRLHHLPAWRESPLYSARERAALAWCEALTLLADTGAPDADYEALKSQFTPEEQVNLTYAICAINAWNRMQAGFRASPAGAAAIA